MGRTPDSIRLGAARAAQLSHPNDADVAPSTRAILGMRSGEKEQQEEHGEEHGKGAQRIEIEALNMKEAAAFVGLSYREALRLGLYEQWERDGVIWVVPGSRIKRALRSALKAWVYRNQEIARPGVLAPLFKAPGSSEW